MWENPANTSGLGGVRATTYKATNLDRLALHLGGKVEFKMAVLAYEYDEGGNTLGNVIPAGNASILIAMGIKETGSNLAQGETDVGTGDIEIVYLPGSEVIPATSNGMIKPAWPPGGKRYTNTATWPPPSGDWQTVTFDFTNLAAIHGFALDDDEVITAGDGQLDATSNGDGVNRGSLEALLFTNDDADSNSEIFYIYIDDVVFESPEPDPVLPPTVVFPIVKDDTEVTVTNLMYEVDEVSLYKVILPGAPSLVKKEVVSSNDDVDLDDFSGFEACITGPGDDPENPPPLPEGCQ